MARGKKRNRGTRDPSESLPSTAVRSRSRPSLSVTLTEVEDFRTAPYAPVSSPARLFTGAVSSVGLETPAKGKSSKSRVPYQIAFSAPGETLVCVRRHRRKQVLHALKKTGKRGQRRPRPTRFRDIKC